GLLGQASASKYPLTFPALSEGAQRTIAARFRARNRGLPIIRLSVDAFGFVELFSVARLPTPTPVGSALMSSEERAFWTAFLQKNADLLGVDHPQALQPSPAPMQCNFNQIFGDHLLASIQINKPGPGSGQRWGGRGHCWRGAAPASARVDGKSVLQKLVGGRVRHVEGGRIYPCDPVDPNHRSEACPPGPPPRTVEWTVED